MKFLEHFLFFIHFYISFKDSMNFFCCCVQHFICIVIATKRLLLLFLVGSFIALILACNKAILTSLSFFLHSPLRKEHITNGEEIASLFCSWSSYFKITTFLELNIFLRIFLHMYTFFHTYQQLFLKKAKCIFFMYISTRLLQVFLRHDLAAQI